MTAADAHTPHPLVIPGDIEAGDYRVAAAYLVSPQTRRATPVSDAVIHIADGNGHSGRISGWGQVCTAHMIDMLEDSEQLDLIIDMGAGYRFVMYDPEIRAGKNFQADTVSTFHFQPTHLMHSLNKDEYSAQTANLKIIVGRISGA